MNRIYITTLGCPKNVVDSGHLTRRFESEGFIHVDDPNHADIILVNTCGFIRDAKEESIEEILKFAKIKKGQGSRLKGQKKLIVFGCLAKRYRDELIKEIPEMDAIFGVGEDNAIIEYCRNLKADVVPKKSSTFWGASYGKRYAVSDKEEPSTAVSYAYLKIAEGCDKKCTFCVIPFIRGRLRSIPPESILKEAEEHINSGVRELILVAQDITKYGKEFKNYNLVSLLKALTALKGDFRIRLLYLYPTEITDELLELIAKEDKIQKYLDIPLQHSEDKILRAMGRRGTKKEYIKLIRNIRRTVPGVALRTTFIVGFPGETEEDFQGLVDFIEEMRFDRLGVFKYSKEEGTPASKLKGHVPERVKDRRLDEIMTRQAAISLEKNRELIGKKYEAIIDEVDSSIAIARLYSHAPEIDGVVIIEVGTKHYAVSSRKNNGQKMPTTYSLLPTVKVGDIVAVEIIDAYDYDLKGILIDKP